MRAAIAAIIAFAALLIGLLVLRGGGTVPIGTFRGERQIAVFPGTDPAVADQLRRVTLVLKGEGDAVLTDGGIPYEGHASRHGDALTVDILAINGINIDRQPVGTPRTLTFEVGADGTIGYDKVTLRRLTVDR